MATWCHPIHPTELIMSFIRSRKHAVVRLSPCATALALLSVPAIGHSQGHDPDPGPARLAQAAAAPDDKGAASTAADPAHPQASSNPAVRQLPSVSVTGTVPQPYKAGESASSPKFTAPLVDTPQTITILKEDLFREQAATTLTEALRNTPGVSTFYVGENGSTNTGDAVFMRGLDASSSIFVDGIRDTGSISRDLFNLESVEVVKGPSGSDVGRGSPTGYINLVTKQPKLRDSLSGSLGLGSASYKRLTADWNKALTGMPGAAFRLNVMAQDAGVAGRDFIDNKSWAIAPTFALGLGTPTRIYADYLHVRQNNIPDGGVPTIGLPGYRTPDNAAYAGRRNFLNNASRVDSSNFYGTTSDFDHVTSDMFTLRFEHQLTPDVLITNTSRYGKTTEDYLLTSFMGAGYSATGTTSTGFLATPNPADPSSWTVTRNLPTSKDQTNEIITNHTNVRAAFKTGAFAHTLSSGAELTQEKQTSYGYFGQNVGGAGAWPAANLYHPDPNVSGFTRIRSGAQAQATTTTVGAYAFDTMKINEWWQITGGLRIDHYNTDFSSTSLSTATSNPTLPVNTLVPTNLSKSGNLLSWKLAAVYKPAPNGSIYLGYATSQQPPGGANFTLSTSANNAGNPNYDPQKAKTSELGTKWEMFNRRLLLSAALYRTDISNDIVQDPTDNLYYQIGEKRVQGVELGAIGQITHAWAVTAGFTTMNTSVLSGPSTQADGSGGLPYTPSKAFTSWTTYRLPIGLTVGGGARYVGGMKRGTDGAVGTPSFTEGYWVVDAMASYPVSRNVVLQLNVYNLFDKDYVASINKSGYRYIPGISRSARLTANFLF